MKTRMATPLVLVVLFVWFRAPAQDWIQTSATGPWFAVASSGDGNRLVAATYTVVHGSIYTSTNAGGSWTLTSAPDCAWASVACSADGAKLVAVPQSGPIWTSPDGGGTWTSRSVSNSWTSAASSADGGKLVAVSGGIPGLYGCQIYTSTNLGETWTLSSPPVTNSWTAVACSADGSTVVAASFGSICASTNGGATWRQSDAPAQWYSAVAMSADGTRALAAGSGGCFLSSDSGNTWTLLTSAPDFQALFGDAASSADGTRLAVILSVWGQAEVYLSTNSGSSWFMTPIPCNVQGTNYCRVAFSADGCRLIAAIGPFGNAIYTRQTAPQPVLNLTLSATDLLLSWLIPSQPFVLQENSDLTTANWTDLTTTPVLNLTNLQNQVTLPLPASNRFYRLKHS